jgi:uncharacterized caspase-like protein
MLRVFLAAIALIFMAGGACAEKRVALVLANDDYKIVRPLKNAVNDAHTVEATLEKLGFDVTSETNRDLKRMRRALEDFRDDAQGADVALIYYSGHGVEIGGDNRLLPIDADPSSLDRLKQTTLPLEEVRDTVTAVAKTGLIVLDACRSDPFGNDTASTSGTTGDGRGAVALNPEVKDKVKPGLGRMGRAENVLFSFSAAPGETASDGANGNSEFSAALAKFLPTDGLEIRSVLTLVQQDVYDVSRGRQLPYVESGLPKLFFAAQSTTTLPERDRLLLAMADVTPDLRGEVETIAAKADMPLAPLYAALITSDGKAMQPDQRRQKLQEAAASFIQVRADLRNLASTDPEVTKLRQDAEVQLSLGAFDNARVILAKAADIDGTSRSDLKERFIERTLSEATTRYLSGSAARAELRYDLAIADYQKAVALYADVDDFDIPDDARYQQVLSLELIGTMEITIGNLTAAGKAYDDMDKAAEKRAAKQPDNVQHQRDLVVAKDKIAEVKIAMGDLTGAIKVLEDARKALALVIRKDPQYEYFRDMAVSYNRSGDARRTLGDGIGALADYKLALRISQRLNVWLPENDTYRRDISVCHGKIGLAYRLLNDLPRSLIEYQVAMYITEQMIPAAPDDMELQRDLTVNLNAIGDTYRLMGNNAASFEPYQKSVDITQKLVARDQANTLWRRDLSIGLNKLGDAKLGAGDLDGALAQHQSALAVAEYLAALDPANADWQRDLSISYNKVGEVFLRKKNLADAAKEFQAGSDIAEAQLAADPDNVQRIVDAAFCRFKLAMAGVNSKDNFKVALDALTKLKTEGRLPGANSTWIAMVEDGMKQSGIQ